MSRLCDCNKNIVSVYRCKECDEARDSRMSTLERRNNRLSTALDLSIAETKATNAVVDAAREHYIRNGDGCGCVVCRAVVALDKEE